MCTKYFGREILHWKLSYATYHMRRKYVTRPWLAVEAVLLDRDLFSHWAPVCVYVSVFVCVCVCVCVHMLRYTRMHVVGCVQKHWRETVCVCVCVCVCPEPCHMCPGIVAKQRVCVCVCTHRFELHRPPIKGTKLLLEVTKAIIIMCVCVCGTGREREREGDSECMLLCGHLVAQHHCIV